jgi:hypothetical protein
MMVYGVLIKHDLKKNRVNHNKIKKMLFNNRSNQSIIIIKPYQRNFDSSHLLRQRSLNNHRIIPVGKPADAPKAIVTLRFKMITQKLWMVLEVH